MRRILIISSHYPPSNLAAVHRSRLFAQHLPEQDWDPIVLTVHEDYYEEALDPNLARLLPPHQKIEKVWALPLTRPRLVGDLGLRAIIQLARAALRLIEHHRVDFVLIPIPSFYLGLLGPLLKHLTGVPYGIDYIDPWVHVFPGSEKWGSRHWWSTKLAGLLEPIAVRSASLVTGVAEGYYGGVIERNPHLAESCTFGAMPYGGEPSDHGAVNRLGLKPYVFEPSSKLQFVYAGAMLPRAIGLLDRIFAAIAKEPALFEAAEFHFIGTGNSPTDPASFTVRPVAERHGIWDSVVFEYPQRIPYLDVLTHLEAADAVFILGSTEPHYTPSKTYQAILSEKPILAVLHTQSTASAVLASTGAGQVLSFDGERDAEKVSEGFVDAFAKFQEFHATFDPQQVDRERFEQYSAQAVTRKLAGLLDRALDEDSSRVHKPVPVSS